MLRNILLTLLLWLSILFIAPLSAELRAQPQLAWQTLAPMPIAVQEIYPAVHNDNIYVAGGLSDALPESAQQMTDAVQRYNPASNSWQLAPALPEPRHHTYLLSVNNKLFLFGGFIIADGGRWSASADVLLLDEKAQQWRKVAKLPKPLTETVAVVLNGQVWRYQASTDRWQQAGTMPLPRHGLGAVKLNNQVYVLGGASVVGLKATSAVLNVVTQPHG